jgi:hypothetical protein
MPGAHVGVGVTVGSVIPTNIDEVMGNQSDLVEVLHSRQQVLNYKGT